MIDIKNYDDYYEKLKKYPFNSEKMCEDFFEVFEKLIKEKKNNPIDFKKGLKGNIFLLQNKIINKIRRNFISSIQNILSSLLRRLKK